MSALFKELFALRKERNYSVDDIYAKTRIDPKIIESIENGSLFNRKDIDQPYLRSFVRKYASALKIDEEDILKALDAAIQGDYDGFIGKKYLEKSADSTGSGKDEQETKLSSRRKSSQTEATDSKKDSTEVSEQPDESKLATSSIDFPEQIDKPDPELTHNQTISERPDVKSVDWVSTVKRAKEQKKGSKLLMGVLSTLIILLGIGIALYFGTDTFGNSSTGIIAEETNHTASPAEEEQLPALPDSLVNDNNSVRSADDEFEAVDEESEEEEPETADEPTAFPDTLEVVLVAADGVLEPVRIRSDIDNTLRPHWIEEGEGMIVEFTDDVELRGQFDFMQMYFNGHPVADFTDFITDDGFIKLTRDYFQENPTYASPAAPDEYDEITIPDNIDELPLF